jgi:DNA-directed RNA polymerase subunit RPC12/RpoP
MSYEYYEYYECSDCGTQWRHKWDDDMNNDYTTCPCCPSDDYEEISESDYTGSISN